MYKLVIPETELFDNKKGEFYTIPKTTINIEHSLMSISKWECKYAKSFFDKRPKTAQEFIEYIKCMTVSSKGIDDIVYSCITRENIQEVTDYLMLPMTARKKYKQDSRKGATFITSEDIYYNMIMYGIPLECEKWHFNRLIALIDYCRIHNPSDNRKMSSREQSNMYRDLNAARRAALHSKG